MFASLFPLMRLSKSPSALVKTLPLLNLQLAVNIKFMGMIGNKGTNPNGKQHHNSGGRLKRLTLATCQKFLPEVFLFFTRVDRLGFLLGGEDKPLLGWFFVTYCLRERQFTAFRLRSSLGFRC